jgi:hypothetical protein
MWVGFIWLSIGTSFGLLCHGSETSGFIKSGEFID